MEPRAIPELSLDTQLVERRLAALPVGDVVSYAELSALIGRDVQREARHILDSARARLLRNEPHQLFAPVLGLGMKRLDDHGVLGTGVQATRHIHRHARRATQKLAAVQDFTALSRREQVQHNLMVAQLGMLAHATSWKATRRLEAMTTAAAAPSMAALLEAMKGSL